MYQRAPLVSKQPEIELGTQSCVSRFVEARRALQTLHAGLSEMYKEWVIRVRGSGLYCDRWVMQPVERRIFEMVVKINNLVPRAVVSHRTFELCRLSRVLQRYSRSR